MDDGATGLWKAGLSVAAGSDVNGDPRGLEGRFAFGANWKRFLEQVGPARIEAEEGSLQSRLKAASLEGLTFLDVGSGSGLFSLAARRLGARVRSFDYDEESVACTLELKRRYFHEDPDWTVAQGSILDSAYLDRLGQFQVVYSSGVLHHTGDLASAMENTARLVAPSGQLHIALYNDQGATRRIWWHVKRLYNTRPWLRPPLLGLSFVRIWDSLF